MSASGAACGLDAARKGEGWNSNVTQDPQGTQPTLGPVHSFFVASDLESTTVAGHWQALLLR
jgi:hypothetical protein